ncbi:MULTISPECIES: ROK family transcriptional regulator [Streptomyces]|uniref:ROK family protein n=1 Tax=Streptomyces tendae TaxID=1932 RepID=A0ABW7RWE8_STRTE|nr:MULTISPECIES: ROK family transcriptional regulator [unclassified Streptomyces]MBQ0963631.1 ROK family transcriptional regulator [Streptomyces sp. RK74B]MBQ1005126.1 ROK family transcriptional regulator [Streptomyces sp. RK23]MZG20093.1 ROK family protein [Streptomyces sp. SID5914]
MRGAAGGANLLALRSHNTALVLYLLRTAGGAGISRLELAERTGLTPQAVSKITARLRGEGLAAEAGRRASTGGKPRTVLRLVPGAGHALGVHLDRDELRAVLVDLDGTVVAERRAPLDLGAGAETVLEGVARAAEDLAAQGLGHLVVEGARVPGAALAAAPTLLGLGVALPGPLDHVRGVLHRITGFPGWDGYPLREALERRLGVPVVVDKDTNAAALGLAVGGAGGERGSGVGGARGSGAGVEEGGAGVAAAGAGVRGGSFAYLHLGTGLGAGLVFGGGVHRGARTGAGEFGHQVVQLDGPPCTCGARGCIEALCLAAVARGDLAEAARVLGTGAANLAGLLDIDLVLLGGRTVAAAPEAFVHGVGAVLDARARREGGHDGAVPVRLAPGGTRGVAEGAAQLLLAPLFGRGEGG